MAQQQLQTIITLSGRVDNTFGQIGRALLVLGSQIDGISDRLINFGKDSLDTYTNYDDIMREVQALGEYDDKTIESLHEYNRSIAQTSKYTMEQAAQAEVMMAQLGLSVEDTRTLMPTVMNLATAANIDLADSLDYLYYTLNALDLPMESVNVLSDQMSKTAAISAADIDTLGQSMQRLGSGAQFFAGGSSEILAILGGISQFGKDMQGSDAGTQLRNFMLTLLAPTKGKKEIMEAFSVTEDEWSEFESYMSDAGIDVTNTAKAMNELGLSVYDSSGELKPAIQIIGELNAALSTMSEAEKNEALGNLFGKRTTTTALNLMAALETIIEYQKLIEGGSTGYTERMAETMEGGIGGALRELSAAFDELKTTVGGSVAEVLEPFADGLSNIVTSISNLDEGTLDALVRGLGAIAAAGPMLMTAGGAMRLIGSVLSMGTLGKIGLVAVGLIAAGNALSALDQAAYENQFGDVGLDMDELAAHVGELEAAYEAATADINAYNAAVETALSDYSEAGGALKESLVTKLVTNATLTEADIDSLNALGGQMRDALIDGIDASYSETYAAIEMLGGIDVEEEATDENSIWYGLIDTLNYGYESAISQANEMGQSLRDAMTAAFADGRLTGEEIDDINAIMQQMNELFAVEVDAQNAAERKMALWKATSLGLEGIEEGSAILAEQRDKELASIDAIYLKALTDAEKAGLMKIRNGETITDPDGTVRPYTEADLDKELQPYKDSWDAAVNEVYADHNSGLMSLYETGINESQVGDTWEALSKLADSALRKGAVTEGDYADYIAHDATEREYVAKFAEEYIDALGGYEPIEQQIAALSDTQGKTAEQQAADAERANQLIHLLTMYDLANRTLGGYTSFVNPEMAEASAQANGYSVEDARAQLNESDGGIKDWADYAWFLMQRGIENGSSYDFEDQILGNVGAAYLESINNAVESLKGVYDFDAIEVPEGLEQIGDYYKAFQLMYGELNAEDYLIQAQVEPVIEDGAVQAAAGEQKVVADVVAETPDADGTLEIPSTVTGADAAAQEAQAEAQAAMASPITQAVNVDDFGSAAAMRSEMESQFSSTITQRVNVSRGSTSAGRLSLFAEGGRADEASIFGEAGPEWAIPEEHSERTASLLDAARQASGFTWPELIERNGGLNAGGGGAPRQLIYSPTIIANDASGVEQKLIEDKARLDKWYEEKQLRDEVEIYT